MSKRKDGLWRPKWKDRRTGEVRESAVWWCTYSVGGRRQRESTHCKRFTDAKNYRARRMAEAGLNRPAPRDIQRVRFEDLIEQVKVDYRKNGLRSLKRVEQVAKHLGAMFANWRAVDITAAAVSEYQARRLEEGATPGTVNRETSVLGRGFRLCKRLGMIADVPEIQQLKADNVRTGFVTEPQLQTILTALRPGDREVVEALYVTAWRLGEILSREWRHVQDGWLVLERGESKTGEPRRFPITPRLQQVLERLWARKQRVEREQRTVVRHIFIRENGRPVRSLRRGWAKATKKAGCPDLLIHDLRRSGIMAMIRAGIAQVTAMKLSGHRTDAIFRRYGIHSGDMLREAGQKLQALHDSDPKEPERKVVDLP